MTTTSTSALAVTTNQAFWNAGQLAALTQIGVQNASEGDLRVFLNFAQRTGLDPFARQIYMIGRSSQGKTKWTIQASIDGLRIVAQRSSEYAGQVGPEFCGEDGVWRDAWTAKTPPVAARVGVLRNGFQAPLYAVAYYDEYVQTYNGKPSQMWADKPRLMLAKCAEALALRKAFPNDLAGLYTSDEMGAAEHAPAPAPAPTQPDPEPAAEIIEDAVVVDLATEPQLKAIGAMLSKCGVTNRTDRHEIIARVVGRELASANELTKAEAHTIIDAIKPLAEAEDPTAAFAAWEW